MCIRDRPECPGTWSLVSGAAGNPASPGGGKRAAAFEVYRQAGFMVLDIAASALRVEVYVLDAAGTPQRVHIQELVRP